MGFITAAAVHTGRRAASAHPVILLSVVCTSIVIYSKLDMYEAISRDFPFGLLACDSKRGTQYAQLTSVTIA